MNAAVSPRPGEPLSVEELDLPPPQRNEVTVRMAATGVCHSDLHFIDGVLPHPAPAVLGHEGAGVVEGVGEGVTYVQPGDHVILSFIPSCGQCPYCVVGRPNLCTAGNRAAARGTLLDGTTRLRRDGQEVYHMTCTACFAERAVVPESGVIKIREEMPLDRASLIGCGVMTGVGAVINTARVQAGSVVAVIGCGGVGGKAAARPAPRPRRRRAVGRARGSPGSARRRRRWPAPRPAPAADRQARGPLP